MAEHSEQQSPEILREIQAAEHKVETTIRTAEQDAAAIPDRARAHAAGLLAEKWQTLEQKKQDALTRGIAEAEREAERIVPEARTKAHALAEPLTAPPLFSLPHLAAAHSCRRLNDSHRWCSKRSWIILQPRVYLLCRRVLLKESP